MHPDALALGACLDDHRAIEVVEAPRRPEQPLAHLDLPHGIAQVGERHRRRLANDLIQINFAARRCATRLCAAAVRPGRCSGKGGDTGESGKHEARRESLRCSHEGCKFDPAYFCVGRFQRTRERQS